MAGFTVSANGRTDSNPDVNELHARMTTKQAAPATPLIECFEIPNTYTRDYPLDKQIDLGINDWRAECGKKVAFGHNRQEALTNLSRMGVYVECGT